MRANPRQEIATLKARIAERAQRRAATADLRSKLVTVVTKQLRREIRADRKKVRSRRKARARR